MSGTPVIISDATQPADQTVTEGLPVTFSVIANDSAPLSYQWFKGSTALDGATNATFTIADVRKTDAGDYHSVVSNPLPSSVSSRTAHLVVNSDVVAPNAASAVATPNKITITFSEPVTENSVTNLSHYSSNGELNILSAVQDPANPSVVVLTTSAQTLGTSYALTINGIIDRFNNAVAPNSVVTAKSRIIIDNSFDDWASVPLALTDPEDSTDSTDYKDVYVTSDDDYIYMRVTLYSPSDFTD